VGRIRKIQKHKEERDRSAKFKKQEGKKNGGKEKKKFYGRWTFPILMCSSEFSISLESHGATALMRPSLRRTHSYGNLPYNMNIVSLNEIRVLNPEFMIFWASKKLQSRR
jgi:hypothetical protein